MKVTASAIFRCSAERYVAQYFDPESRHRRTVGTGGISFTAHEVTREGPEWHMRAELVERVNAPLPVRKVFGETNRFEEESRWTVGSDVIRVVIRPEKMREKLSITGAYRFAEQPDGTTRVSIEVEVVAKVFGIGGMIEKMATKEVPDSFAADAAFFNENLASPG